MSETQSPDDIISALRSENKRLSELVSLYESIFNELPCGLQVIDKKGITCKINNADHERSLIQKTLKHSHDLMSYIIHHNRSAIAVHDRDLRYIFVSQRYLSDYKITDPDIIGKHHYEVFPDLPQKWRDVHQRALHGEVISAEDDKYIRANGTIEWTRWECRPWFEADNSIGGIIVYTEVITERKVIEEALKETNATLLREKQKAEESEAQFRYFLDWAPVPMFIHTHSRFAYVNNALVALYKSKDASQILGSPVIDRVHPDYIELVQNRIRTLNLEKKPVEKTEYKYIALDKSVIDVEVSAVPIRFGETDGALVYVNDITRQKQVEEKLIESQRILKLFVEYAPASIAMFDTNMHYLAASRHYLIDFGLAGHEIIGKPHYELFPNLRPDLIEAHQRSLRGEVVIANEDSFLHPDGKTDWVRWETHPWYRENHEIGGIILLSEVITDRKVAEIKLKENMDLLSNLAKQVPGVIYQYQLNPDGSSSFPYSSEGMYDIYEVTPEEVKEDASPVFTRIHPDDHNYIVDTILESARTQSLYHSEFRVILPEQGIRWRSCFARPQTLPNGSTLWHGIITDITARKEIEKELELKNEELNTFFDCALDLLCIATNDGYFLRLNREWEKVLGYSIEELMAKSFLDFIHPDDIEDTIDILKELSSQKQISSFINRYKCKTGEYKWIEWKSFPGGDKIYAAARDVTSRMLFENELEERIALRTQELSNANKELEAFSYSVSHDLRSPLRAIIGFTNILTEEYENKLDDEGKRICHAISSSAVKMGNLIDDLLSFSRLGRNELTYHKLSIKALIESAYNETVSMETRQHIDFICEDLPDISGDNTMLKQVWINLISNAVKYSSKCEKPVIHIGFDQTDHEIIYIIRDNGIGFDMQYVDKLFGVFHRLHNSKDFEGTGVGLAIVQRIIHRHGGRVWAEGAIGKGATFYIALPKSKEE